ncbi:MAG: metal ABC transporter permease [Rhodospirillaceae bacterium]|nr:metal ABC transporter permease [Rhodospirillaceae bacterium]
MLDDFFTRALIAGIGVALAAGPLGCFVVWRRMAYFGDTMAHSALLGVALALLIQVAPAIGVFAVAAAIAVALSVLQRSGLLAADALLGVLAHAALGLALVMVALMSWLRIDVSAYLFGDILTVGRLDLLLIYLGGAAALAGLVKIWRRLLADTVDPDLLRAEGVRPEPTRLAFALLLAAVIAVSLKIVGALLVTALLIIPAATVRPFARGPVQMAAMATGLGVLLVVGGLFGSLHLDTPSGPTIVVTAFIAFLLATVWALRAGRRDRNGRVKAG